MRWVALTLLLLLAGCSRETTVRSTADSTAARTDYEQRAEQRLAELRRGIDSLRAQLGIHADSTSRDLQRQLDDLEGRRQTAQQKLAQLRGTAAGRWSETRQELADLLRQMGVSLDSTRTRLKR